MTAFSPNAQIELFRRGWREPLVVGAADIIATWSVSEVGAFSCRLPTRDFRALGLGRGHLVWLRWTDRLHGAWGGVITSTRVASVREPVITLNASSFAWLLSGRPTPVAYRQQAGRAGAHVRRLLNDGLNPDPLPFTVIECDESGPALTMDWRGEDSLDVLRSLANLSGQEWNVTVEDDNAIAFRWKARIGRDRRHEVLLAEGAEIVDGEIDDDVTPARNTLLAVANNRDYERSERHYVENAAAVRALGGHRMEVRRYDRALTEGAIRPLALADVRREATPPYLATLHLDINHPTGRWLREGDTVRAWLPSINLAAAFRGMSRTVDQRNGLLILAGEARGLAT